MTTKTRPDPRADYIELRERVEAARRRLRDLERRLNAKGEELYWQNLADDAYDRELEAELAAIAEEGFHYAGGWAA